MVGTVVSLGICSIYSYKMFFSPIQTLVFIVASSWYSADYNHVCGLVNATSGTTCRQVLNGVKFVLFYVLSTTANNIHFAEDP